jgi:hypothetical protein
MINLRAMSRCAFALLFFSAMSCAFAQAPAPDVVEQSRPKFGSQPLSQFQSLSQSNELGTLEFVRRTTPPPTLTFYTAQTYFHTDNLFLNPFLHEHADAWVGAFGASYVPYSTYRWTPRLTVEGTLDRFSPTSIADFNTESIAFDNRLGLTDNNLLSWTFNVSALRAERQRHGGGEFYSRVEFGTGLDWFVPLKSDTRWLLHLSPRFSARIAHPNPEERYDATAALGLFRAIGNNFGVEPFVELGGAYYPNSTFLLHNRKDLHLRSGINCVWNIADHWAATASVYWLGNYSTASGADYQILPSVSVSAQFAF